MRIGEVSLSGFVQARVSHTMIKEEHRQPCTSVIQESGASRCSVLCMGRRIDHCYDDRNQPAVCYNSFDCLRCCRMTMSRTLAMIPPVVVVSVTEVQKA